MSMLLATMIGPNDDDCRVGADEALSRLMEGNARFLRGERRFTQAPIEILADLIEGQHPFAVILGCSDLRVPPELIFDAKFGDLFVIRVAGNVVSPEVWGCPSTRVRTLRHNLSWSSDTKAAARIRRRLR